MCVPRPTPEEDGRRSSVPRSRRHFLPASSIGYFSSIDPGDTGMGKRRRRRNRVIWVLRRGQSEPREDVPDNVANSRDVYHPGMGPIFDVDSYFSNFEVMNDDSMNAFFLEETEEKLFSIWIRLAAYISSRIARNPDSEFRLAEEENNPWPRDRRGVAYIMDMQRISAAVLRTRWAFLICNDEDFIINDRGFVGIMNPLWNAPALLVPMRKEVAVVIGAGPFPKKISWDGSDWRIQIPVYSATSELVRMYNALSWIGCREESYGSSSDALREAATRHSEIPSDVKSLAVADDMFTILGVPMEDRVRDELLLFDRLGGLAPPIGPDPPILQV